jgi:hypothetical protein
MSTPAGWPGVIERSRGLLSVTAQTPSVTLCGGNPLTGHGLKDQDTALESASRPATVPARLDGVFFQRGL